MLEDTTHRKKEVQKLSKEEVQECINKRLCFKCGEKWSKEHKLVMRIVMKGSRKNL